MKGEGEAACLAAALRSRLAEALAQIRNPDLNPALAAQVYVCRPPTETPTGRYLGTVHFQRLLRDPPSTLVGGIVDRALSPLRSSHRAAPVWGTTRTTPGVTRPSPFQSPMTGMSPARPYVNDVVAGPEVSESRRYQA